MASGEGRRTQLLRGALDLCLLAVMEEGPAYGYEMTKRLRARGLSTVGEGSIYPLLGRLEREGLVETYRAASDGGPPRKYYRPSAQGHRALAAGVAEWRAARDALDAVLGPSKRRLPHEPVRRGVPPRVEASRRAGPRRERDGGRPRGRPRRGGSGRDLGGGGARYRRLRRAVVRRGLGRRAGRDPAADVERRRRAPDGRARRTRSRASRSSRSSVWCWRSFRSRPSRRAWPSRHLSERAGRALDHRAQGADRRARDAAIVLPPLPPAAVPGGRCDQPASSPACGFSAWRC